MLLSKKKKRETLDIEKETDDNGEIFYSNRKTVRELCAPFGVNPNPLEYMVIDDNGTPVYVMCFYVLSLPKKDKFATTFTPLFNFPHVTSSVFINPLTGGKSSKQLDKRIRSLDSERIAAEKDGDRNRYRKIHAKLNDTEVFASDVESGDNRLYEVQFLFTLCSETLDGLRLLTSDFHNLGREKGVELAACYSVHPEAFLSGYPTNRAVTINIGPVNSDVIKKHIFDKSSLSAIFNHTTANFTHKSGIIAGRNMTTGQPVLFDAYAPGHTGYGVIICGKTGTGKSATIKMYLSRYCDFDYKIRSIDFEQRGNQGEYSMMCEALGGINYPIKVDSTNVLNPFEIDKEEEYDEVTGKEYPTLNLIQKVSDAKHLLMTMIKNGKEINDFNDAVAIERIVGDIVSELYGQLGYKHGDVESLYETGLTTVRGKLMSGKVRKKRPTIHMFYERLLQKRKQLMDEATDDNSDIKHHLSACITIQDAMQDFVREINYCPKCLHIYTREQLSELKVEKENEVSVGMRICKCCGSHIKEVRGSKPYFDGQSAMQVDQNATHINIDLSSLLEKERPLAMLVAMSYFQESCIKKNSANPKKVQKMVFLVDELHRTFEYPEARVLISDTFRTARKRFVSPWVATQALADFKKYEETKAIVKNATTLMLLKQDFQDRSYIKEATPLTDSQIEKLITLGGDPDDKEQGDSRRGEICLIDNGKVSFIKVDYLKQSEAKYVETDMGEIQKMYRESGDVDGHVSA